MYGLICIILATIMECESLSLTGLNHQSYHKLTYKKAMLKPVSKSYSSTKNHLSFYFSPLSLPSEQPQLTSTALLAKNTPQNYKSSVDEESPSPKEKLSLDATDENLTESIFSLAVPALAGLAIDPLMTLADTAFVGRFAVNADSLAGLGTATALLSFCFYIFNFLCTATTPLVSQRRAAGDEAQAKAVAGQALSLALMLGTGLCLILLVFGQSLLSFMGTVNTGAEANAYALSFLNIRSLAAPAIFISSAATGILRGYLDTKTALVILVAANIVNLLLDVILIPGLGMGPTGAAIATTTAEWICAISFLGVLNGTLPSADGNELGSNQKIDDSDPENDTFSKISPSTSIPPWEEIQPLIVASSSIFLRSLVLQVALAGAAAMAARNSFSPNGSIAIDGAAASVAAHQIAVQLWLLCSFICDALAAASQALIADALGRSNAERVREVSNVIITYSLILGIILAACLEIGKSSHFLLGFFTTDIVTQNALSPLLSLVILAQPLNSFVFAADGIIQGASEFAFQAKGMVISVVLGVSYFVSLEYFGVEPPGSETLLHVWEGLIALQIGRALTSTWKLVQKDGPINILGSKSTSI